ncbi:MAG: 3-phosphoshikimate 1-carboxyvinyltransferase [Bacteroidetes bacterium]|nr:3-phosphoshikimate 1-carboxyvinyltransferase [Bacteroidota bacterium]MBS1648089.1 3-phosphoshikimate 1-carboxyvinyltransferase [Bacteroidota bacterium]
MIVTIQPSTVHGKIMAPASKSSMQRACAAALLKKGKSIIYNYGISNDDKAALSIIEYFGATIIKREDRIEIDSSNFNQLPLGIEGIHCGESGLSIRMFAPIVALNKNEITINGTGSLATRPMNFFDEIFPQLNIKIKSNNGKLPLIVKGPLQPKNIEIDGSLSSQFLTGLLMAYAASNANNVSIKVTNLKSKPYIDLTLKVMNDFGMNVPVNNNYQEFIFTKSETENKKSEVNYMVESDWSGGAFLLVAGAIAGNIIVKGLDTHSTQADKKIIEALKDCKANILINEKEIHISNSTLKAFEFDATDCPDLFPPLVALASYCNGTSLIKGVSRLAHKESNRGLTLQQEFAKFGVEIILENDVMKVNGGNGLKGTIVHSHHDHRIAMACAVAALKANKETIIEEADAVNKSYPNFYEHLQQLGVIVKKK